MKRRSFLNQIVSEKKPLVATPIEKFQNQKLPDHLELGTASAAPFTGTWDEKKLKHLLRRALFGYSKADLDFFKTKSMSDAMDYIMDIPTTQPLPPVNAYNNARETDPNIPAGSTWVNGPDDVNFIRQRRDSIYAWHMKLIVNSERHIREKMTLFLHNHFATETEAIPSPINAYNHHKILRENALGNFKDLIKKITIDSSMLFYLNGYVNTKTAPDENYARELMELFTLGKSAETQYTENDVKAAAKVLTGWSIDYNTFGSFFNSQKHDTGSKTFSSFYNNKVISGQTGVNGANETDELINMIFTKEDIIARFIVRKLYRYFVYYVIDSSIETNVIIPLANIFKQNWELKPVVTALLKSEHFYDDRNIGCMIKNPVDVMTSLCKYFKASFPNSTIEQEYSSYYTLWGAIALTGMNVGNPPNVSGWPAYYQTPQFHQLWLNSDTLPKRISYTVAMISNGIDIRGGGKITADVIAFAKQFPNPENPDTLIQETINLLYAMDLSTETKNKLKESTLLFGLKENFYWTNAWNDHIANPTDNDKKNIVVYGLTMMLKYLLDLAENQLA